MGARGAAQRSADPWDPSSDTPPRNRAAPRCTWVGPCGGSDARARWEEGRMRADFILRQFAAAAAHALQQLAAHAEISQLHLAQAVEQDVARLDEGREKARG